MPPGKDFADGKGAAAENADGGHLPPGEKLEGVAAGDVEKRSTEIVAGRNGMNYKQVQPYIRLTQHVPELQSMVNEKKLSFTPAVEISFIKPKNQRFIAVSLEGKNA